MKKQHILIFLFITVNIFHTTSCSFWGDIETAVEDVGADIKDAAEAVGARAEESIVAIEKKFGGNVTQAVNQTFTPNSMGQNITNRIEESLYQTNSGTKKPASSSTTYKNATHNAPVRGKRR